MDPFSQLQQEVGWDAGLAVCLGRLVLSPDGGPESGYAVPDEDLGQTPLVLG
jgi:hypothetical protein